MSYANTNLVASWSNQGPLQARIWQRTVRWGETLSEVRFDVSHLATSSGCWLYSCLCIWNSHSMCRWNHLLNLSMFLLLFNGLSWTVGIIFYQHCQVLIIAIRIFLACIKYLADSLCPKCTIWTSQVSELGQPPDMKCQEELQREDSEELQSRIRRTWDDLQAWIWCQKFCCKEYSRVYFNHNN